MLQRTDLVPWFVMMHLFRSSYVVYMTYMSTLLVMQPISTGVGHDPVQWLVNSGDLVSYWSEATTSRRRIRGWTKKQKCFNIIVLFNVNKV